tara:strand:- start:20568 stop:21260 length:693 start_codon:yes stop_codon:yes gene_type:complete
LIYLNIYKVINKIASSLYSYLNNPKRVTKEILSYKIQNIKGKYSSIPKFINFVYIFNEMKINNIRGSIVEVGTAGGLSLSQIVSLRNLYFKEKNVYSFDTFENTHSNNPMRKASQLDDFCIPNLINAGIENPKEEIIFVIGDVKDTLKEFNKEIAFLHIDVDLPEVYEIVLKGLWNNLGTNSIIVFDEYDKKEDIKKFGNMKLVIDDFLSDKNFEKIENNNINRYCIKKL